MTLLDSKVVQQKLLLTKQKQPVNFHRKTRGGLCHYRTFSLFPQFDSVL